MKKQIFFCLLLLLFEIGETNTNFIKLAITSFEKGYYELSNKYLEDYIASEKEEYTDYVYLLYGYNLYNLGKYEEAIEKFQTLISKFPLSQYLKNAYLSLLSCYWKVEDINSLYTYYLEYRNKFKGETEEVERKIGGKILQTGINFFKNKEYQEGKKYFFLILDNFKDSDLILWANYHLGLSEFEMSNFTKAIEYFDKVINLGVGDIFYDSKLKIGDCYLNTGKYEQAEKYYNEILKETNSIFSQWAKFQISMIEKRREKLLNAVRILEDLESEDEILSFNVLNEKVNIYILLENWDNAEKNLNLIINRYQDKKEIPEIYFKLGIVNFNKRDFDRCIYFLKKTIENKQNNLYKERALFFIGYVNYLRKEFEESFKYWGILENEYPESSFNLYALFLKGRKYYDDNNLKDAEEIFKKIVEKSIDNYYNEAITSLIEILIKEEKFKESEFYAKKFLEKKYDNYINFLLGKTYYLSGEYKNAKDIFENLKIENPIIKVEINFYLGKIYQKMKDEEKAKKKFIEIINLYPEYKEWKEKAEKSLIELKK